LMFCMLNKYMIYQWPILSKCFFSTLVSPLRYIWFWGGTSIHQCMVTLHCVGICYLFPEYYNLSNDSVLYFVLNREELMRCPLLFPIWLSLEGLQLGRIWNPIKTICLLLIWMNIDFNLRSFLSIGKSQGEITKITIK
jgi:hypothetical protein